MIINHTRHLRGVDIQVSKSKVSYAYRSKYKYPKNGFRSDTRFLIMNHNSIASNSIVARGVKLTSIAKKVLHLKCNTFPLIKSVT